MRSARRWPIGADMGALQVRGCVRLSVVRALQDCLESCQVCADTTAERPFDQRREWSIGSGQLCISVIRQSGPGSCVFDKPIAVSGESTRDRTEADPAPRLVLNDLGLRGHVATHEAHHFMSSYSDGDLAWRFVTHFRYSRTPLRIILVVTHVGEDVVPRSIDQNGARHGSHEATLPRRRRQPVHAGRLPEHRRSRPWLHTRDRTGDLSR